MEIGEQKIREVIEQKVAHYLTESIPEEEWEKIIKLQIDALLTGSRKRDLQDWIKEDLDKRIKKMISSQMADADYWGQTWGSPAGLFKEVVAENADKLIEAMFKQTFDNMAYAMKQAIERA